MTHFYLFKFKQIDGNHFTKLRPNKCGHFGGSAHWMQNVTRNFVSKSTHFKVNMGWKSSKKLYNQITFSDGKRQHSKKFHSCAKIVVSSHYFRIDSSWSDEGVQYWNSYFVCSHEINWKLMRTMINCLIVPGVVCVLVTCLSLSVSRFILDLRHIIN